MALEWILEYHTAVESYAVRPELEPGEIAAQLPMQAPRTGEPFEQIMADFCEKIVPGMTHWQHPSFFGYFPAATSPAAVIAEMLAAGLNAQCMSWETSPAATELEQVVMEWLRQALGLPQPFTGVLQDSASVGTLCAILAAREQASDYAINRRGVCPGDRFTVYCSEEAHSSIEKAMRIAGLGSNQLRKIGTHDDFSIDAQQLRAAIWTDVEHGHTPLCIVGTLGTTSSTAIDSVSDLGKISREFNCWLHIDAALGGCALVLPEMRWMLQGVEAVDSIVVNPHKWLLTNLNCSVLFVRNAVALVKTFEILPEYLKTPKQDQTVEYRNWGIQLGRPFRSLKLWFVLRAYGLDGLRKKLKSDISLAWEFARCIVQSDCFELMAPVPLNTVCFRYKPATAKDENEIDRLNQRLIENLNRSGKLYLSHTKLSGSFVLRLCVGQTSTTKKHVRAAWKLIQEQANCLGEIELSESYHRVEDDLHSPCHE